MVVRCPVGGVREQGVVKLIHTELRCNVRPCLHEMRRETSKGCWQLKLIENDCMNQLDRGNHAPLGGGVPPTRLTNYVTVAKTIYKSREGSRC